TLAFGNLSDAFTLVPQATADKAFNDAAKMVAWVVENERAIFSAAAKKDIPELLKWSLSKKERKPASVSSASLNPAWNVLYIRHGADCPIELQYELDLETMTKLNASDLVVFVGQDLHYRNVKLRGGFNSLE